MSRRRNKYYDRKLKLQAVQDYLGGGGSLRTICKKHGIKDKKQLRSSRNGDLYDQGQKDNRKGTRGDRSVLY